jgi:DNA-binding phage protein
MSKMRQATIAVPIRKLQRNVLQETNIPPRSYLYSLPPRNVETIWRESLTGYMNRLAKTHHISPRDLVAQEILPRLGDRFSLSPPRLAHLGAQGMSLNGLNDSARAWASVLDRLTGQTGLHLLTLAWWIGDLFPRKQLRETPSWCPSCLSEWREKGETIYQPLCWMFQIVTICSLHQNFLLDRCPSCQKRQTTITANTTELGQCVHCKAWLGTGIHNPPKQAQDDVLVVWQSWVMSVLKELHGASLVEGQLQWEPFFRHLAQCLKEGRAYSKLARLTGISRENIHRWVSEDNIYVPTLETICRFCYVCNVTPLQIMRGQVSGLKQIIREGLAVHPPRPRRSHEYVDQERCRAFLQTILDGREEPLGVSQAAKRLGYADAHRLTYHFPQECAEITQQAIAYRKQRKEQLLAQIREEVRLVMLSLHTQGIYPSQRKLRSLLPPGFMLQSEANEAWHATLHELGFES